ncbi:hypothetical protein WPS_16870 [Vulcanimicrobium alpinum]|uniref:PPM-type phosphatase domain-containing protein n=1 Tax=Vulcanimicrobium alpinum TaxID=3016050 RepID=A0AAN1XXH5_UNVUL|nr:SpoIIE family protein phosphatase [Vulcanimicrobium alpinum]BDE06411.1 hypothetical protein WPS_16870 [Vulcanimicrobium alpinum]
MDRRLSRSLVGIALIVALVVPIVVAGGFLVRSFVGRAFSTEERVRETRLLASQAVKLQLDQETGVRGFAATRDPVFLEPYQQARDALAPVLADLRRSLVELGMTEALPALADGVRASDAWTRRVALPLTAPHPAAPLVIQRYGKGLMDRYRNDLQTVEDAIGRREAAIDAQAQSAIDRINIIVIVGVLGVAGAAALFAAELVRSNARLEQSEGESARLQAAYETERRVAETLQDAFLQRPLPVLPAVSFSATYVPATEEAKVGGDWYDGVELSRERVLCVIGDVAGHGLEAAVSMNRARQALVTAAVQDPDPGNLLARVNRELIRQDARMVTAVCGFADARRYEFVYATAGHPPPVLIEPGRPPRLLEFGGLPLAVSETAAYRTSTIQTVPGAMLVLYTDGAVEHSRDVIAGEQTLLDAVSRALDNETPNIAAAIHGHIFDGRVVGDDVAILTVAFAPEGTTSGARVASGAIVAAGARSNDGTMTGTVVSINDLRRAS